MSRLFNVKRTGKELSSDKHPGGVRWSLAILFSPRRGLRRSARGCCTRLPWETDDDAQPQRGYGSVPHITLIPFYVVLAQQCPRLILLTVKVATLSGLDAIRRSSQGS